MGAVVVNEHLAQVTRRRRARVRLQLLGVRLPRVLPAVRRHGRRQRLRDAVHRVPAGLVVAAADVQHKPTQCLCVVLSKPIVPQQKMVQRFPKRKLHGGRDVGRVQVPGRRPRDGRLPHDHHLQRASVKRVFLPGGKLRLFGRRKRGGG